MYRQASIKSCLHKDKRRILWLNIDIFFLTHAPHTQTPSIYIFTDTTCLAVSRRRRGHPLSPLFAAAEEGSDDGEEDGATDDEDGSADALVSNLKGKHRRALRSLAGMCMCM